MKNRIKKPECNIPVLNSFDFSVFLEKLLHVELLLELSDTISHTALCGLGKSAPSPVVSTINNFRHEYEEHIYNKKCSAGVCKKLKTISIDPSLCKGCSKCSRSCPVEAISGKIKEPFSIDLSKCIRCGSCISTCPFGAIKEG